MEALQGHRVVDVACGSGDAQTLCLTEDDTVWSWGDGDYGKLGRGGSDGCKVPMKVPQPAWPCPHVHLGAVGPHPHLLGRRRHGRLGQGEQQAQRDGNVSVLPVPSRDAVPPGGWRRACGFPQGSPVGPSSPCDQAVGGG